MSIITRRDPGGRHRSWLDHHCTGVPQVASEMDHGVIVGVFNERGHSYVLDDSVENVGEWERKREKRPGDGG